MSMQETIMTSLKEAMKKGDSGRVETLRMLQASIKNLEIEKRAKGAELTEDDVIAIIRKEVKKRKESSDIYRNAGREDLAVKEDAEAALLEEYLPAQMTEDEIEQIVREVMAGGVTGFGPIMQASLKKIAGRADSKKVSEVIKRVA